MRYVVGPRSPSPADTANQLAHLDRDAPARHGNLNQHNLRLLLEATRRSGRVSRANLAASTGLTKATISNLVDQLTDLGLLMEVGTNESGKIGRPGRLLTLNGDSVVGIGLEANVDYAAVCVLDMRGVNRFSKVVQVDNRDLTPDEALDCLAHLGNQALDWVATNGTVAGGMTVGLPGLVDIDTGTLLLAPNLGWHDLPVAEMLGARLTDPDLTIRVDNEANLGALGELWEGGGQQWGDFVHISGEIGVGAGIVFGGALWRGFGGFAGEIGHIQVDRSGPVCPCGSRGCLERFVGREALLNTAGLDPDLGTSMGTSNGGAAALVFSAEAREPATIKTLIEAGRVLGTACTTVANLLNPRTIVLGGIYGPLAPWIVAPLTNQLQQNLMSRRPQVMVSHLGVDAAVRGAASSVLHDIVSDPRSISSLRSPRRMLHP